MDTPLTGLSSVTSIPLPESPLASDGKPAGASSTQLLRFRSIYILPTRQGVGFAVAVLAMLLGSINYGNALGYVLSFILIGAGLVSMLHAVRNLSGLGLLRYDSAPVFAGDMARFGVRVDNRGQRQRFGLLARLTSERRRSRERDSVLHFHLDADSVKHIELAGVAARRGWYSPGPVTIATRFPFGLFRAWTGKEIGLRCLVFPRPAGDQALPPYRPEESGDQGRAGKGDDEFSGLRDYQQGDSARRVHWKAVARGQRMPVKVFSGATSGVIMLRWQDVVADDTESRLSQLSRWVVDADAQGLRYGLCLPGVELPADGSHTHRQRCLEALALFDAAASP